MKITTIQEYHFGQSSSKGPKPAKKHTRRKTKKAADVRLKKDGTGGGGVKSSSRPATPLLRWKFDEDCNEESGEKSSPEADRKVSRKGKGTVSSRKLAASLWRMQLPEGPTDRAENLEFQSGGGNMADPFHGHHSCKDLVQSPHSVSGPIYAMEGATKWDPINRKKSNDNEDIYSQSKLVDQMMSELEQARARIDELETEQHSSKKKVEHFLRKLSEERAAWRSREHEKIRAVIDDMKSDLTRERKNRQRLEIVNSKLVKELSDTKSSAKRYMQDYEKERRSRELIEEVCNELAKEIAEDKAEIDELNRESMKFQEEVDEERKMLQMAEVWREERVQMKLLDAKVILEDKFSQMNKLVADLESILNSIGSAPVTEDIKKAEMLREVANDMSIQEIRDFRYERPNPDDMFSIFEDPAHVYRSGELEEDRSEWETVDDQGSSSPGVTNPSVNPSGRCSNVSGSGSEWEGDKRDGGPTTIPNRQLKKVSSISRLWKSSNGENYKIISVEGFNGSSPRGLSGQRSLPSSGNPHINRGMKGCIDWPRNGQKNNLKTKLLMASIESEKIQLRQVLKQKI